MKSLLLFPGRELPTSNQLDEIEDDFDILRINRRGNRPDFFAIRNSPSNSLKILSSNRSIDVDLVDPVITSIIRFLESLRINPYHRLNCHKFVNLVCARPRHTDNVIYKHFQAFPGDVIKFFQEGELVHSALYLELGYCLSVFGDLGDIGLELVSQTATGYKADRVEIVQCVH